MYAPALSAFASHAPLSTASAVPTALLALRGGAALAPMNLASVLGLASLTDSPMSLWLGALAMLASLSCCSKYELKVCDAALIRRWSCPV
jgi:hypothetical protein